MSRSARRFSTSARSLALRTRRDLPALRTCRALPGPGAGAIGSALAVVLLLLAAGPVLAQRGGQPSLPEGEGKMLVEFACTQCHGLGQIVRSPGYDSPERWREVFASMVELAEPQAETVAAYLAEHFPEDPGRRPTLVPGDARIEFTEWVVPTLGQRSRDPAEGPNGDIWWTGMWASLVGRLDPETGGMEEYHLPPSARPHSIVPDAEGDIWYTGNSNATIGELDPETGTITEYPTEAGDPHTPVFHPNGNLYFTSQRAGMLGRLDPESGELTEVETEPRPYGIQVGPDGTLWVAYNGTNRIGAMDPETMVVRFYTVPNEESRIRRLGLDSDGIVWYVNSTRGKIGRLDPDTGEITEWDSPSGPDSHPYALAVIDDIVWYNESGMRPDALVRFDPETEEFQSWAIPSGVGIIRRMWVTRDGNLLIHQSSSNRVGIVRILDGEATAGRLAPGDSRAADEGSVVAEADIPEDIHPDSWARLPLPVRDELDAEGRRAYDAIVHPDSRYSDGLRGPVAMWVYSPEMARHVFPASTYLRYGTEKDQRLTELAILSTAREVRSQYEWTAHEPLALQAGLEPEIIELVKRRGPLDQSAASVPGLGERERAIIRFAREVVSEQKLGSETFAEARGLFGDRGVMDLAGLIGYYSFVNITLKTFDVQLAPGRERRLPDLW